MDWIRSDVACSQLNSKEHCSSNITRVYFHQTVSDSYHFAFTGSLRYLNEVYHSIYDKENRLLARASQFKHGQVQEAKDFVDNFVKRSINLKVFL